MVDIKDFLINDTLVQYNVTNSIISSHVCYLGLLPPPVHLPSAYLHGQPAAITCPSDVLLANEEQKKCLFMAQPQAPSVPL